MINFNLTQRQLVIAGGGILLLLALGILLFTVGKQNPGDKPPQLTLTVMGVERNDALQPIFENYKKLRSNVKISYTQIPQEQYAETLLNAMAAGKAPDVAMIHSSWLTGFADKLQPAASTALPLISLRALFPQVVETNFSRDGKTYALPLSIDTLALFYNKDIFDSKTIVTPPVTWTDFQNVIPQLRLTNTANQIIKPAAGIGGSEKSIPHASDILDLLFMQAGEPKIASQGTLRFDADALRTLQFYLGFADPQNTAYTWNDTLPNALAGFAQGTTAMAFGYAKDIPTLKGENAFLNFDVAPAPQLQGASRPITIANYWGFAVTRQSANPTWAWDFILTATADQTNADSYTQTTHKPPALRALIQKYANDPSLGVFAKQALTARAWQEPALDLRSQIFSTMIESALSGRLTPQQALSRAEAAINGNQ